MVLWKPWIVALIPWKILSLRRNTTMAEKLYKEEERGGEWERISENKISSLRIVSKLLSLTLSLAIYIYIYIYSIIIEDQEPFKGFYTNKNLTTYNYYSVKSGVTAGLTVIKNNQGLLILAIRITSRYSSSSSILNFCFCVWHSPLALTIWTHYWNYFFTHQY